MRVTETNWGKIVTIPETENNSEFVYQLRNVRTINDNEPEEQPLINRLERAEKRAEARFLARAKEMEQAFAELHTGEDFDRWEHEHGTTFNEYFHDELDRLCELVNSYSFRYAEESKHGWCL